jgi:hypothetical protein
VVTYTPKEYKAVVPVSPDWGEADDFVLLGLCRRYDCRWAVIADRWPSSSSNNKVPSSLACKERYFVLAKLAVSSFL